MLAHFMHLVVAVGQQRLDEAGALQGMQGPVPPGQERAHVRILLADPDPVDTVHLLNLERNDGAPEPTTLQARGHANLDRRWRHSRSEVNSGTEGPRRKTSQSLPREITVLCDLEATPDRKQ